MTGLSAEDESKATERVRDALVHCGHDPQMMQPPSILTDEGGKHYVFPVALNRNQAMMVRLSIRD
ncbi:hypothetical protein ACWGNZ_00845 [Sphingomonas zeae]